MGIGMRPDATVDNVKEGGQGDVGEVTPGCQVWIHVTRAFTDTWFEIQYAKLAPVSFRWCSHQTLLLFIHVQALVDLPFFPPLNFNFVSPFVVSLYTLTGHARGGSGGLHAPQAEGGAQAVPRPRRPNLLGAVLDPSGGRCAQRRARIPLRRRAARQGKAPHCRR